MPVDYALRPPANNAERNTRPTRRPESKSPCRPETGPRTTLMKAEKPKNTTKVIEGSAARCYDYYPCTERKGTATKRRVFHGSDRARMYAL